MRQVRTDRFKAQMCRESYREFFKEFWPIIAAEKLNPAWYIWELCDELQTIAERVFADLPKDHDTICNCPPGTSKSSNVSILWQPWIWTRMPSARFISGSYAERLALDLSRKSRDVVTSDKYRSFFPEIELRDDQNTKGYFANKHGGIRYAVGVGGSVIGMHAHFIAVDDPIDPQAALSDLILAEANTWMSETLSRRKVNVMLTPTVVIMQQVHQDDPTGNLIERRAVLPEHLRKLTHFCMPADTSWEIKPERLRQYYSEDGLMDPVRLGRQALDDAQVELLETGYACQYGQQPVPRGGSLFKIDRLQYSQAIPKTWLRGPVRYWDKACTPGGGAYTVGVKMLLDMEKRLWVLDVIRGQWDSGTREGIVTNTAELDGKGVRSVHEQEPGSSGKDSADATIKRLTLKGFRATADKVTGDKELRADLFSQLVNSGSVVLVNAPWNKPFVEEMRYFPRSKYKDQMDAASGGCNYLIKRRYRIGAL